MAEGIFKHVIKERNLIQCFELDSAGTGAYHVGSMPDQRAKEVCEQNGIKLLHQARQVHVRDFEIFDYIIAMDTHNFKHLQQMSSGSCLMMMRDFDVHAHADKNVPDPYYGGVEGFQKVYEMLLHSSHGLVDHLMRKK